MRNKTLSLKSKFLLHLLPVLAVVQVGSGLLQYQKMKTELRKGLVARANQMLGVLARAGEVAIGEFDLPVLEKLTKDASSETDITYVAFFDRAGSKITQQEIPKNLANAEVFSSEIVSAARNGEAVGKVEVGYSTSGLIKTLREALLLNAIFSVTLFLAIGLTIFFLFNRIIGSLKSHIAQLNSSSMAVADTADLLSDESQVVQDSADLQAQSVNRTASALANITEMASKTSTASTQSKREAELGRELALAGQSISRELRDVIQDIRVGYQEIVEQIGRNNKDFTEVVGVIRAIESKTTVINEIVFQTKLLSFNAAVEAARAGEHGRGFAVVAEEIGNLASMSGGAAGEIAKMVSASVQRVESALANANTRMETLVRSASTKVDARATRADKSTEVLAGILKAVEKLDQMLGTISELASKQTVEIKAVETEAGSLGQLSIQGAQRARSLTDSSNSLREEAQRLKIAVADILSLLEGHTSGGQIESALAPASEQSFETGQDAA